MSPPLIVFTDLDSTLLDHEDYSYEAAKPALLQLEEANIPLIINTSKTLAEVFELRQAMNNAHPFVTENGAAIYIPDNYFAQNPADCEPIDWNGAALWEYRQPSRRKDFQGLISAAAAHAGVIEGQDFTTFAALGPEGIARATGLSVDDARLANQRAGSEPVQWLSSAAVPRQFISHLQQAGARVIEGGRFLHVMDGNSSKGNAMHWLARNYTRKPGASSPSNDRLPYQLAALGDSPNDIDMLNAADYAMVIRKKSGDAMQLEQSKAWMTSNAPAPAGWAECVGALLSHLALA